MDTTQSVETIAKPRGWPLFLAGFLLIVVGPVLYAIQFQMGRLNTPWYMPILATTGVLLMAASLWVRMGILRSIGLVFFGLFCAFQWYAIGFMALLPSYTGPAQAGVALPAFAAKFADGGTFSNADLEKGRPTVLVFFRGHW
jgi:hypothetical protein